MECCRCDVDVIEHLFVTRVHGKDRFFSFGSLAEVLTGAAGGGAVAFPEGTAEVSVPLPLPIASPLGGASARRNRGNPCESDGWHDD